MGNQFNKVPIATQTRSRQNLSSTFYGSHDFGRMDVVYCNSDIIPGDNINLKIDGFLRGAPMPAPTYGNVDIDIRVFFVPHRIATFKPSDAVQASAFSWDNFISGVSSSSHPYATLGQVAHVAFPVTDDSVTEPALYTLSEGLKDCRRLMSQLGLPDDVYNGYVVSNPDGVAFSERINLWKAHAYQRVWWDYYRDSSLIEEQMIRQYLPSLLVGKQPDDYVTKYFSPRYACFRKDYFTTAKLNPQSGTASVAAGYLSSLNTADAVASGQLINITSTPNTPFSDSSGSVPIQWIRAANSLQKYLERNNLAGTRLMERFLARFGVSPKAESLDMSEYLGGNRTTLQIGDITANNEEFGASFTPQNAFNTSNLSGSSVGTIQGQLGGKCAADCNSGSINYHAKEFGTLIAIQTIVPHVSYVQGLSRELSRGTESDKFDYFTPEMENLGYQPVYQKELTFISSNFAVYNNRIFGFNPRYQDYRSKQDVISGDMVLSETSTGMDSWHLARFFATRDIVTTPTLNSAFTMITAGARHGLDRIFSIQGDTGDLDHFTSVIHSECHIDRPMSASALPSLDEDLGQDGKTINIQNGGVRM